MKLPPFSPAINLGILISGLIAIFAALSDWAFPALSLDRIRVTDGELWRLFTCNFVHFGTYHTLMNLAAFVLCVVALLDKLSLVKFGGLLVFCCLAVGLGIYLLNPEYETYAGLSGVIHGLIVAGLLLNRKHAHWINAILLGMVFAKIIYEHQDSYHETQLQELLPVAVAYDAHLYGAIAGLIFGVGVLLYQRINTKVSRDS